MAATIHLGFTGWPEEDSCNTCIRGRTAPSRLADPLIKVALFSKRPQKIGLIYAVLALPLYAIYYADRIPFWTAREGELHPAREWSLTWLEQFDRRGTVGGLTGGADIGFVSDLAPAAIAAVLVLVHMTVFQRVGVRRRLQRIHDPVANFFAGATAATMIGGILVSTSILLLGRAR